MDFISSQTEPAALWQQALLIYWIVINLITFCVYGLDKAKARKNKWRVPESRLLVLTAVGGSFGALFGMLVFHHKTKKWKFRVAVPIFLVVHILIATYIIIRNFNFL
ncbi:DUF1294 domain-containing protein [Blautia schinkii]|nr:DUF1294 domain-containing protein [Blautia schinkii]